MKGRLLTIGYEGRSIEGYLAALREAGVTVLCDVRRTPLSHKPGFSKRKLGERCARAGIRYEHLPELGIAPEHRRGVKTPEQYDALFTRYAREWLPAQASTLERIQSWLRAGEAVALTCFEHDAARCHRRRVAEALTKGTRRRVTEL